MWAVAPDLMHIRPLDLDRDYPVLMHWWNRRGVPILDKAIFPEDGAVAEIDGTPVAMSFLYLDRAGRLAMLEWTSVNPGEGIGARTRLAAVKALYANLEERCRAAGCLCLLSMVDPESSEKRILSKSGWHAFEVQDKPHVMFAKRLKD